MLVAKQNNIFLHLLTQINLKQISTHLIKNKPLNGSENAISDFESWSGWTPSIISTIWQCNNQIRE